MTASSRVCAQCGHPIPPSAKGGECPVCLVRFTLDMTAPPPPSEPAPPDELQPHFPDLEILSTVGRGGMGVVYKARQSRLGRLVALKLLAPHLSADPAFAERFFREAQALARLSHPHIVAVHDVGRAAGSVYLVMEYVEGDTLRDRLRTGRLAPVEALRIVPQLCDAIQYAHDRGVIHRDIKPENVLLLRDGTVKVADFGLAKVDDAEELGLTGSGVGMGTALYMAPEQRSDAAAVDHRADIYSLGVLFYEMLTGDLPTPHCKPPSTKAGSDPRLDAVVSKSLQAEPAERYQHASEIKTDVERIAAVSRWRRLRVLAAGAVLALATAATVVAMLAGGKKAPAGTERDDDLGPPPPVRRLPVTPTFILTESVLEWTPPENLGPGVNTPHREQSPCVAADGLTLVFASDRPGGRGDLDLWECRRATIDKPFGDPVNLGPAINGPGVDNDPCLSADGLTLVFVSVRGDRKDTDIWMARRPAIDAPWGEAENLGPEVNSEGFEFRPWLSADGLRLTFSSLRPPREAVYVSRRGSVTEPFGTPVQYGRASDRLAIGGVSFSSDDRTVLCHRFNRAFPGNLLWLARVDDHEEPFRNLVSFGPVVNSEWIDSAPAPSGDGRVVYFQSNRPGGEGDYDLWRTRRVPKRAQ